MRQNELIAHRQAWLVGAGPGDPELLTRKAERLIALADIIFYDALVGPGVVALAPHGAELIAVGKRSERRDCTSTICGAVAATMSARVADRSANDDECLDISNTLGFID